MKLPSSIKALSINRSLVTNSLIGSPKVTIIGIGDVAVVDEVIDDDITGGDGGVLSYVMISIGELYT